MAIASLQRLWVCVLFLTGLLQYAAADIASDSHTEVIGTTGNLTLALNVPANETDDLFFHFSAPARQQWAAFGFGSSMKGSLMFVVYSAEDKVNVTLSPRLGIGHSIPEPAPSVQTTLLPGSQIDSAGNFVVNAKCTGCRSWSGGSLNVNSTAQQVIFAVGPPTTGFASDNINAGFQQHSDSAQGVFALNMQKATGDAGVPVIVAGNVSTVTKDNTIDTIDGDFIVIAHTIMFTAAFLIVFPGGYLFLRVFEKLVIHAALQSFGLLLVVGGTIFGVVISKKRNIHPSMDSVHQGLGLAVFGLVILAWILGFVGHLIYKKTQMPAIPMKIHRGVGPTAIVLGLVNVAIGLNFARNTRRIIPFAAITLLMVIGVSGTLFMVRRKKMRQAALSTPAALNFNQAHFSHPGGSQDPPKYPTSTTSERFPSSAQDVPMETFGQSPRQNMPPSTVHPGNRIH